MVNVREAMLDRWMLVLGLIGTNPNLSERDNALLRKMAEEVEECRRHSNISPEQIAMNIEESRQKRAANALKTRKQHHEQGLMEIAWVYGELENNENNWIERPATTEQERVWEKEVTQRAINMLESAYRTAVDNANQEQAAEMNAESIAFVEATKRSWEQAVAGDNPTSIVKAERRLKLAEYYRDRTVNRLEWFEKHPDAWPYVVK